MVTRRRSRHADLSAGQAGQGERLQPHSLWLLPAAAVSLHVFGRPQATSRRGAPLIEVVGGAGAGRVEEEEEEEEGDVDALGVATAEADSAAWRGEENRGEERRGEKGGDEE